MSDYASLNRASLDAPEQGEVERRPKHRARRSAAQRRAQLQRSQARALTKLLSGLASLEQHRGCQLSRVGEVLFNTLRQEGTARVPSPPQQRAEHAPASSRATHRMPLCRHHAVGRCTFGAGCRFSHQYGYNNDNEDDEDAHRSDVDAMARSTETHSQHNVSDSISDHIRDCDLEQQCVEQQDVQHDALHDNAQHDDEQQLQSDHDIDGNNDEIDEIIAVINSLAGDPDSQQQAMELLPPYLLHEAMSRLEQHLNYDHNQESGEDDEHIDAHTLDDDVSAGSMETQSQHNVSDSISDHKRDGDAEQQCVEQQDAQHDVQQDNAQHDGEEDYLSASLNGKISTYLRLHNGNKKLLRKLIVPSVMSQYFRERSARFGTEAATRSSSYSGANSQTVARAISQNTTGTMSASPQGAIVDNSVARSTSHSAGSYSGTAHLDLYIEVLDTLDGPERQKALASLPDSIRFDLEAHFDRLVEELSEPD